MRVNACEARAPILATDRNRPAEFRLEPMEARMSQARTHTQEEVSSGVGTLSRLRAWWQRRSELDTMSPHEMERLAEDVATTAPELRGLVARGPHAADELRERMRTLGLARDDVEKVAPGLMRDLERTCSFCADKGVCRRDLADRPDDSAWQGYCPNAVGLTCVAVAKRYLAG
jgi:hypothetical protein